MGPERLVAGDLLARARSLRGDQSKPESVLWAVLRDRRLRGLKFRRQHPIGPYVADFYCAELQWVIEVDGGQHNTELARAYDARRSAYLATRGATVTRFWSDEVMSQIDGVVLRMADVAATLSAGVRGGTLTPALSQREREKNGRALSQRQREDSGENRCHSENGEE
jgi:very-short-patch-repair endonuclease